jgi:hypothetical protein
MGIQFCNAIDRHGGGVASHYVSITALFKNRGESVETLFRRVNEENSKGLLVHSSLEKLIKNTVSFRSRGGTVK